MRILVVGDGKVGHTLAENLAREEHSVVIVDNKEEALHRSEDTLDVMCVRGNGANAKTLMEAEVDKADIVIAATASDETNMLCCLLAKRLGAKYAIARIRDPEYNESLTMLQHELGIDLAINPERATALEISRLLRFPFASNIESFAKGHVELVEFRAQENDTMVGVPLKELGRKLHGLPQVLYAAVERDGIVTIPNGDFVIHAGDRVHVVADMVTITAYFRYLGKNSLRVRNVMLLGGGRISYYLAKMIAPMGIRVTLVELDEKKAAYLSEELPDVNVLHGDGTEQELLNQEGLNQMDAFVALSNHDEENLMTGLFAVRRGVPKVIVKNNRVAYEDIINAMGLDSIVSPRYVTCANILRYVRAREGGRGTKVEKLYRLVNGKAEALEFVARSEDSYIGIPLKDLNVRKGTLVAVIVRKGKVIVPFGSDHIEAGDSVIIIACESGISDLNEVIRK
ncbi:MAG: Trk system potassium transporter TrkA [Clostridia bacterium]|nr:Trk system potassium transporter TrkA [Clostridia bacterium]